VIAQLAFWVRTMRGKQRIALQKWLTDLIEAMHGRILGFNVSTAHVWAEPQHQFQKQFHEELMPKYREMLTLFTNKYHLADADTRAFYSPFLEFVEIWNMWLAESLEPDVPGKLGHAEENVKPFYAHLEATMQALQDEIARG
jgi:hypothetical protein